MSDYSYENVKVDIRDGIGWASMNRPEKRNAMSPQLHYDMQDALARMEVDPDVRVVVITGEGGLKALFAPRAETRMIGAIPDNAAELRARSGVASLSADRAPETRDPNNLAPFICYLASDYAGTVNGQTFLVHGDTISLMSQPRPLQAIYNPSGHWTMEELAPLARDVLTRGITNPAPPQEPR